MVEPRVEYERSYVLLPQMGRRREAIKWRKAAAIATAEALKTIGHSADDAGVGPQEREVIAVNPDEWEGDLREFFDEYYPSVDFVPIDAGTPAELSVKLLPELDGDFALSQSDPRWADYDFGEHPDGTLEEFGCLVTCLAMILRKVYGQDVTPPILDEILVQALAPYTRDNLLIWEAIDSPFPKFEAAIRAPTTRERIGGLANAGWEIVLHQESPSHFVLFDGWHGGEVQVIDPADGKREVKRLATYESLRAVEIASPPSPQFQVIGAQQQIAGEYRDEFVASVEPNLWKLIGSFGTAHHIKDLSPDTKVIVRYHEPDWRQYVLASDKDQAAQEFIDQFRDTLLRNADAIDFVEGLNEWIATDDYEALEHASAWVEAFCSELERIGYPARPICFNTGVGNPQHGYICDDRGIPRQVEYLVEGARALEAAGGASGYHGYWGSAGDYSTLADSGQWTHYSMRSLLDWDSVFAERGVQAQHVITECGAIWIAPDGSMPNARMGWRYPDVLDGDVDAYVEQILQYKEMIDDWNQEHDDRCLGSTIFLHGTPDWTAFDIAGEPSRRLAEALSK